ncbi:TonB-dependent receptor [Sphingobium sp. HBC34]|uniref:TonB-dependent receptor n=1 Tax=Sphingobium cyanobacteriorum TaxID=3063954 RepID=A0ABT8ZQ18_9SPHN|nr:TonB-dependent receptor [Sphingobium sp. HBC34]MDO7836637.1 TonB-dependent receptor [Sphingobium sp. HBC34]
MNSHRIRAAIMASASVGGLTALGLMLTPATAFAQAQGESGSSSLGSEIIVTAQKREERLQDVPVPVTAVTANTLIENNQLKAQDFFSSVPGLNLQFQNNRANLSIRGITTGPATGNPVVGYTIDDIPYGSSAGLAGLFGSAPDLDPTELARIEVLRGPQGTLYGASSMGGLVKYVTVDPSTQEFSGTIGGGLNIIRGSGDDVGYNLRGAINVPLSETFAVRASAFTREDPGYLDNVVTGQRNVNQVRVSGGRLSGIWKPSDDFSIKLSALIQDRKIYGSSDVDSRLGSRYQQTNQFGTGPSRWKNQMYSAVINASLGNAELTSLTAFSISDNYDTVDFSAAALTGIWPDLFPEAGVDQWATVLRQDYRVKKFSQEIRIATPITDNIDWIVGGFYTHEATKYSIQTFATDATNGTSYGLPILWRDNLTFKEYAGFTNLVVRLSDQFDLQGGLRYSENRQLLNHREWTFFGPAEGLFSNPRSKGHALTYHFTPRFKISPDHMVYGRIATGYRPGGPNATCDVGIPCDYRPDKTTNYEIGAKGDLLNKTLSYDVSFYYIDWKDIQVTQVAPAGTFNYNANANRARSQGVEMSFEARPAEGLTLTAWGAYTDATLREDFTELSAVYAAKGDRLPFSSRWSGRVSANQEFPLSANVTGFANIAMSYVGFRQGEFVPSAAQADLRQRYPAYTSFDLTGGIKGDDWRINLFIQNLTNKRGLTGGGFNNQTTFNPFWFNYTQPRTMGFNIEKSF